MITYQEVIGTLDGVLEVYPGPDGMIRTVKVKTKDSIFIRPIQKLCLLENDFETMKKEPE